MKRMNMPARILGELGTAQAIFLVGLALLIVVLLVRSRRYFRQVTQYQVPRPDASGSPALGHSQHAAMPPRDFEKWEVAMHDLARDLSGQLDSKIRVLELLIREADKAAARLETALARTRNGAERSGAGRNVAEPMRGTAHPTAAATKATSPNGKKTTEKTTEQVIRESSANAADQPRFDRIYALADAGLSPATIANQIGSQIGEVELILGIRRKGSVAG
jgi:hypothetical protein